MNLPNQLSPISRAWAIVAIAVIGLACIVASFIMPFLGIPLGAVLTTAGILAYRQREHSVGILLIVIGVFVLLVMAFAFSLFIGHGSITTIQTLP